MVGNCVGFADDRVMVGNCIHTGFTLLEFQYFPSIVTFDFLYCFVWLNAVLT